MRIVFSEIAEKHFKKLDGAVRKRIQKYLREVGELEDPRTRGELLTENWTGYWRYRIGDYRAICDIVDNELIIYVIEVGHRRNVY